MRSSRAIRPGRAFEQARLTGVVVGNEDRVETPPPTDEELGGAPGRSERRGGASREHAAKEDRSRAVINPMEGSPGLKLQVRVLKFEGGSRGEAQRFHDSDVEHGTRKLRQRTIHAEGEPKALPGIQATNLFITNSNRDRGQINPTNGDPQLRLCHDGRRYPNALKRQAAALTEELQAATFVLGSPRVGTRDQAEWLLAESFERTRALACTRYSARPSAAGGSARGRHRPRIRADTTLGSRPGGPARRCSSTR